LGVENLINGITIEFLGKEGIHTNLATCFAITALVKSSRSHFLASHSLSLTGVGVGAGAVQIPYLALTSRVSGPEGSRTRGSGRPAAVPVFILAIFHWVWGQFFV
jgi:hypothetical protein